MKRLLLIIAVSLFLYSGVDAQVASDQVILLNYKTLTKKASSSDAQILDEKKSAKSTTWVKRGKIYQDVFNQGLEQVQLGSGATSLKIFYGDPLSEPEVDTSNVETYVYETINYLFEDGKLRGWSRNNPISKNPLNTSLVSYQKAVELTEADKQLKLQGKLKPAFDELKDQFQKSGQSNYYRGDYTLALQDFESILEVNKFEIYENLIDTMMINFSGIVAREIGRVNEDDEMYRHAIAYYKTLTELSYGGTDMFIQMTRDYYAIGDTLGAIDNLKRGLKQYPDSSLLVTLTAQAYYLVGDNVGGMNFVDSRIEETPECATAYYWKGLLITNEDNLSEDTIKLALDLYEQSLMLDPTQAAVSYQAGYVYYALGANFYELEGYEDDPDYRKELTDKGKVNYEKSAVMLEKTYEIAGDDFTLRSESLDFLKRIYYKLYGSEDSRYLDVMERIKAL